MQPVDVLRPLALGQLRSDHESSRSSPRRELPASAPSPDRPSTDTRRLLLTGSTLLLISCTGQGEEHVHDVGKPRRLLPLLFLSLAALAFATGASVSASPGVPQPTPPGGHVSRSARPARSVQLDPGLAYITTAWEIEYMTCAKLLNYPDTPWDEHEATRLRPGDRSGDADHLRRPPDVHLPDPQRLRLLAARDGPRHRGEHEVHDRAGAEPRRSFPPPISSSRTSRAPTEYHERSGATTSAASLPRATP